MRGERSARIAALASLQIAAAPVVLWSLVGTAAGAESTDVPAVSLQEIVVSATKRDTPILETPISMTVIGSDVLETANIDAAADFERLVPGLTAIDSGPGEKRYALRCQPARNTDHRSASNFDQGRTVI